MILTKTTYFTNTYKKIDAFNLANKNCFEINGLIETCSEINLFEIFHDK